MTKLLPF